MTPISLVPKTEIFGKLNTLKLIFVYISWFQIIRHAFWLQQFNWSNKKKYNPVKAQLKKKRNLGKMKPDFLTTQNILA